MTQTSGDADFLHKRASFIQHSLPGLDAGRYQISVQQALKTSAGADISGTGLLSVTRTFGVAAPRFSLSQDAIHSVFPQPNGAGEFSGSLAHVVLETEKLPWQRTPYAPGNQPSPQTRMYSTVVNGETVPVRYDDDSASWLGVLLVSPSDFGGQDPSRLIAQGTVNDLIPGTLGGTLPANAYSVFSYLLEPEYAGKTKPPIDPGVGILATDAVRYLDVPCTLFNAIAPSIADLEMSAHVRAVEMDAKPIAADATVDAQQQYAVVIGNRLPESLPQGGGGNSLPPPGTNVAMLVSYEALQFALRGHQAGSYYDTSVASLSNGVVRLAVLYQWRFTSWQDTSFEFEMLLKALNGRNSAAGNAAVDVPNPMLRLPSPPVFSGETDSQTIVQDMLSSGYLPYPHLTRVTPEADPTGTAQTVSWYRGPLIPFGAFAPAIAFLSTADPVTGEPLIFSADQLLRFDPNVGMYDVSYAAAWQLGQLLALYNKDFAVPLYRWKQQAAMALRGRRERSGLDDFYQDRSSVLQHLVRSGRLTR